jgi:hypothetical protein
MAYYRYEVCAKRRGISWEETSMEMYNHSQGYPCSGTQPALKHESYVWYRCFRKGDL